MRVIPVWTSWLYSLLVSDATHAGYSNALAHFTPDSGVLDVGVGNGEMIRRWSATIRTKRLRIVGIDTNERYLAACRTLVARFELGDLIDLRLVDVESFAPSAHDAFDYVLFGMSFMLVNDPVRALERSIAWLKPGGQVVFVQTMFSSRSPLLDWMKPKLKYLTTVDFGRAIYESEFMALLDGMGLKVIEDRLLMKTAFGGQYRLVAVQRVSDSAA